MTHKLTCHKLLSNLSGMFWSSSQGYSSVFLGFSKKDNLAAVVYSKAHWGIQWCKEGCQNHYLTRWSGNLHALRLLFDKTEKKKIIMLYSLHISIVKNVYEHHQKTFIKDYTVSCLKIIYRGELTDKNCLLYKMSVQSGPLSQMDDFKWQLFPHSTN